MRSWLGPADNPRLIRSNFGDAVTKFAALVAPAEVSAVILIHSSRPGQLTIDNTFAGHHPHMMLASTGLDHVITWLAAGIPRTGNHPQLHQYQQWQTFTMTRVLEQKPGTPQAQKLAHYQSQLRTQEEQQAAHAQRNAARKQAAENWLANRRVKKRRRKSDEARQQQQFVQDRRQRRQDQVLKMQHDALNKDRPGWKKKNW